MKSRLLKTLAAFLVLAALVMTVVSCGTPETEGADTGTPTGGLEAQSDPASESADGETTAAEPVVHASDLLG